MQFKVHALSPDQMVSHLIVDAPNEADARRQVEARGLFAASVENVRGSGRLTLSMSRREGKLQLVLFSQELLALLSAGLSIVEALEALLEKEANAGARLVFSRLLDGLRDGKRFSSVLEEQSELFPPLYIGIVKAAEGTSDLPQSLARYVNYRQRVDTVRSKIISAAIYPVILLVVGTAVASFLIAYVVPRFAEVYQGTGRSLPWMSQLLLDWGHFAASHTRTLLMGAVAAVLVLIFGGRQLYVTGALGRALARIPGVGERIRIIELSRLYLTLGMLLEGGIPIVAALETVEGMMSHTVRENLAAAKREVQSGQQFSVAFENHALTTPISLRMLRVGEKSGSLGAMLSQSASFYDGEISRFIERFTRSFEPILMAAIGLIVGAIVVLLYMPIFDLAGSLS